MRVTFVVPRYGVGIIGGAESAARAFAEHLVAGKGWEVEVLTGCAEDFVTWADAFPPGVETINGVRVRRFAAAGREGPVVPPVLGVAVGGPGWRLDRPSRTMDRPAGTGDSGAG